VSRRKSANNRGEKAWQLWVVFYNYLERRFLGLWCFVYLKWEAIVCFSWVVLHGSDYQFSLARMPAFNGIDCLLTYARIIHRWSVVLFTHLHIHSTGGGICVLTLSCFHLQDYSLTIKLNSKGDESVYFAIVSSFSYSAG